MKINSMKRPPDGLVIYIVNNQPYIMALDRGRSKQSKNFVAKAIQAARNELKKARLLRGGR